MSTFKKAFLATAVAAALTGTVMAGATESRLQSPHTAQLAQATGTQAPNVQGNRHATLAERLAKRHEHRMARLKEQLKITPEQEAAWRAFVVRMAPQVPATPPSREALRERREQWRQLSTPQRLQRLDEAKAKRDERMAQRHEAIRSLYANLTEEQRKIFDQRVALAGFGQPHMAKGHRLGAHGHRPHHRLNRGPDAVPQDGTPSTPAAPQQS